VRKKRASSRHKIADPKYKDLLVSEFINNIMKDGKKHLARRLFYDALEMIEQREKTPGLDVFKKAMSNARPLLEVKARRVGGATYQVPTEVRSGRSQALAIRWLIGYAKERKGRSMSQKLADELIDASKGQGSTIKKKEDTHRMAEANKAFAHFRW
jgi:small subunit ribosomal protein S7